MLIGIFIFFILPVTDLLILLMSLLAPNIISEKTLNQLFPLKSIIYLLLAGVWVVNKHRQGWYRYFHWLDGKEQWKNLWRFFKWKKTWKENKLKNPKKRKRVKRN